MEAGRSSYRNYYAHADLGLCANDAHQSLDQVERSALETRLRLHKQRASVLKESNFTGLLAKHRWYCASLPL